MSDTTRTRPSTRQERAALIRQYHELMAPHIKAVSGVLGLSLETKYLMVDGSLAERICAPEERKLLDSLNELSEMYAKRLGLATPSQAG